MPYRLGHAGDRPHQTDSVVMIRARFAVEGVVLRVVDSDEFSESKHDCTDREHLNKKDNVDNCNARP